MVLYEDLQLPGLILPYLLQVPSEDAFISVTVKPTVTAESLQVKITYQ